jgi:tetratricopeptide (TPR) repeat protein
LEFLSPHYEHMNKRILFAYGLLTGLILVLHACSTEKDAAMNRWYHQTTTKYNGLFNAKELIHESMKVYLASRKEDYTEILPIEPLPNEEDALAMFPALDTAISKCTKVIGKHSMPSFENRQKKDEYNKWIDRTWLTIGEAKYIKRDYLEAIRNFEYIVKFFKKNPSKFTAKVWIARSYIRLGDFRSADNMLKEVQKDREKLDADNADKQKKTKSSSKIVAAQNKKGSKDKEKPIKLPKDFDYMFNRTRADLAIHQEKWQDAEKYLSEALSAKKVNKKELARMHFILAQLAVKNGSKNKAVDEYTATLKRNAKFEMHFAARLNRAMAGAESNREKLLKELNKMLRDSKNAEFKDQIYYALGDIAYTTGDKDLAMQKFTKSVFYSISNDRQKGASYERMGDITFADKNYVRAQKYYDSCVKSVTETNYKNYYPVKKKAEKLFDLVKAIETIELQDSLLRIAAMSESDQLAFAEKVKKQLQEEEKKRKEAEERRLAELQSIKPSGPAAGGAGGKWYFYNQKQRTDGFEEFKRIWGQRPLEDDWRRAQKTPVIAAFEEQKESDTLDGEAVEPLDKFSVEGLLANVPKTDSAIAVSKDMIIEALYKSGRIYQEELQEPLLAQRQYEEILNRNIENKHNVLAAYQLYAIHTGSDESKSAYYKEYVLNNYPNSDYANYLRDPEYFVKRKERERLDLDDYDKLVERFRNGMYSVVRARANSIVENDPKNAYRQGYMLLYALASAATSNNKEETIPYFQRVIDEYPNTPMSERAAALIDIIKNGYSPDILAEFGKASEFEYSSNLPLLLIVMLDSKDNPNLVKTNISNFNREFFSGDKLKVVNSQLDADRPFMIIRDFPNEAKAKKYMSSFQKTKKHVADLQNKQMFLITTENFAKFVNSKNLEGYLRFYDDFYN